MIYFKNQHRKSQNSPWACTKLCLRKSPQIKMFKAPQKKSLIVAFICRLFPEKHLIDLQDVDKTFERFFGIGKC